MTAFQDFSKGLFKENPIFVILLGLCPALAVSNQVVNALGMGAGVIFVLLGSNIFVSLLKNFIPEKVRIPSYIVIIASFVTIVDLVLQAYLPTLSDSLGVFVKLIVVNCAILGRAEAFANRNNIGRSILDALGMGIGFTLGLVLIALVREVFGAGTITIFPMGSFDGVIRIPGLVDAPVMVLALAAGALLVMGYLKAFFNWLEMRRKGVRA
ncbi:MAG: electron transport complex subunit RsxE [Spirochaetales bacterium]|nr:electron transport complex subunit RsxE [Spirochaetales bacterium]MCF7937147.1 electron transport complex subunit RsxE [Spirochaetales bacterium]